MWNLSSVPFKAIYLIALLNLSTFAIDFYEFGGHNNSNIAHVTTKFSNCSENQVVFGTEGECYKIYGVYNNSPCGNGTIGQSESDPKLGRRFCQPGYGLRANIYHPSLKECFPIYSQGPCNSHQWIVVRNSTGICEENPCLNTTSSTAEEETVLFEKNCVTLSKPSKFCKKEEHIEFDVLDGVTIRCTPISPSLGAPIVATLASSAVIPPLSCGKGEILTPDNTCAPVVDFA